MSGMPHYREPLLSAWPDMVSDVGAPPPTFDQQFLSGLKVTEFGMYGPNARGMRRNQIEDTRRSDKAASVGIQAPKFLSEKARESANTPSKRIEDEVDELAKLGTVERRTDCPPMYRNVEIKYSKFGVDDFDFGYSLPIYIETGPQLTILGSTTKHLTRAWRYTSPTHMPTHCCKSYISRRS